jgi:hypothetical protein
MTELEIKAIVRFRDGYRCVECGMTAQANYERWGRNLEVHRLVPGSAYTVEGAVALCSPCHHAKPKSAYGSGQGRRRKAPKRKWPKGPWFHQDSGYWCAWREGKRHYLDRDERAARAKLAALLIAQQAGLVVWPVMIQKGRRGRRSKGPWFHQDSGYWCVHRDGRRHYLSRDRDEALAKWRALQGPSQ